MKYALIINISILILVAIGTGVLVYNLQPPTKSSSLPVSTQTTGASSFGKHIRQEETDITSIDITYPTINEALPGARQANEVIQNELDLRISQFEKEASSSLEDATDLPETIKSYAEGGYVVEYENDRLVSLLFSAEWYLRGAAHPYHTIHPYVFDKKLGKLVPVQDLFKPNSSYLDYVSSYARADLVQQSKEGDAGFTYDEEMLKSGTEAVLENFRHALPLKEGLVFYFDEYQVAPYAAGSQQVVVPYGKLKAYVEPTSAIGELVK